MERINLSKKEKGFLICCITMAAGEGYYMFPRYQDYFQAEGGIKYDQPSYDKILNLLRKLGADNDDIEVYIKKKW